MKRRTSLFTMLLFSGCTMVQPTGQRGTLILKSQITSGNYGSQAVVDPYTKASINHLILKLYTFDGTEHDLNNQQTLLNAQLDNPIVFTNLKANSTYRIKGFAYASTDESVLISSNDASSSTDVILTTDDRPILATLQVKLIDRAFNGQATSSLNVVTGGYSPIGSESLSIPKVVSTLAGSGAAAFVDGVGTSAAFNCPNGIAIDSSGNLFVADYSDHRIRKITPGGGVTTFAGSGNPSFADGTGTAASFYNPECLAIDATGTLYVTDLHNHRIRKITPAGVVTTIAGNGNITFADGTGTAATFSSPQGIAVDAAGNLFVGDYANHRIRKITPSGVVTTLAGNGGTAFADGIGTAATFNLPYGVAVDAGGNVYVGDLLNNRIRKITSAGVVTTFAGNGNTAFADGPGTTATFHNPCEVRFDANGNLLVADANNQRIRKIDPQGVVTTIAGNGNAAFADGPGSAASFNMPEGLVADAFGNIYVAENGNNRIRKIQ